MDKTPVEVSESEEGLYLLHVRRRSPFQDSLNLSRIHADTVSRNDQAQVQDFGLVELALVYVKLQASFLQRLQYSLYVFSVVFQVVTVDQDVVYICRAEYVQERAKDIIYIMLEGTRSIC